MTQPLHFSRRTCLGALALLPAVAAQGAVHLRVDGIGRTRVPVGVMPFEGDEAARAETVAAVLKADFLRSGQLDPQAYAAALGLDSAAARTLLGIVSGRVLAQPDGRLALRWQLWDPLGQKALADAETSVLAADRRLAIHRIADEVQRLLTGVRGAAATRIAYVVQEGRRHLLKVADADGHAHRPALASHDALISPAWSPDGRELAYVSFERGQAQVWVQDLASGRRRALAAWRGSNSAPAWSPDGRSLALALSRDGQTQVYVMGRDGGEPVRVTRSLGIDTEPAWAPDGQSLYFVSDRGGAPQVYRTTLDGSSVQRLSWGAQALSPAPCPNGRHLAYVVREQRAYRLVLQRLDDGSEQWLTPGDDDERPSFAPNGQLLAYATRRGRHEQLKTTSLDGRTQLPLVSSAQHDVRQPAWGPWVPELASSMPPVAMARV